MSLVKNYLLTLGWLAVILFLTLSPGSSIPPVSIFGIDKLAHLFLFFVLILLFTFELKKANPTRTIQKAIPIGICLVIGILIECIQIYVPQRTFSLLDIVANTSGIAIGMVTMLFFKKKF